VFFQIQSNILGTLFAIRKAGSLGLEGEGGEKYINYPGKIIFQGQYNPFGKQFKLAIEGVGFVGGINAAFAGEKEAVVTKCSEKAAAEGGTAKEQEEKREACVKAFSPAYAVDSGRCGEHAEKLEPEEEAITGTFTSEPFTRVPCTAAALQPGFNALQGVVNLLDHETVAGVGSCYTDPQLRFNPQKSLIEAERLKKWTNMTNATKTETETVFGLKAYNGPDIHPTPAGYSELAAEMVKEETKTCHTEGLPGF